MSDDIYPDVWLVYCDTASTTRDGESGRVIFATRKSEESARDECKENSNILANNSHVERYVSESRIRALISELRIKEEIGKHGGYIDTAVMWARSARIVESLLG
jgi:hypothetical protein